MKWKNLAKNLTNNGLKLIGGIVAGKSGEKVGELIASTLGVNSDPDSVAEELKNNPDAYLKLQELETNHKIELEKLYLQEFQLEVEDKKSARDREVQITKTTGKKDWPTLVLGSIISIGFFGCISALLFLDIPQSNKEVMLYLLGALSAAFTSLVGYYFGSSKGSSDKTAMLMNGNNKM